MAKDINELIDDLGNSDEFVQEEAIADLELRSDESTDYLIEALTIKKSKDIKIGVAKVLGFIGDSKAIDPLIATLKDPNKLVRREASTALSRMGDSAVEPLINILDSDDWKIRGAAAWALGNLKDLRAIEPLEKLLKDESGFVKAGAKWAIDNLNKSNQ
ncbi:HEAT repeat domain-containing protein [Methanobrevibacter filiformis]|uniref:Putative lyase n=1 Tax=Methanobrevibacter filiformis TaxID=55758 RepID=A0A166D9V4_9EURY|nr:HEAT repeat domain-containing protein [Methanobrevibacter filiformis]KZX15355.1 putative lyase [Methanobrevibacter filiformis]